eukprot:406736_1
MIGPEKVIATQKTQLINTDSSTNNVCGILKQKLIKYFFLIGLLIIVVIAWFFPEPGASNGILKPEITSSWIVVILIFFVNGITVQTKQLTQAAQYWQLMIVVQFFIYIWFPFIGYIIFLIFYDNVIINGDTFNEALLDGLVILCCIPTTIAASIVYTQSSGGNEAAAIINSALSNIFGIIATPLLIYLYLGNLTNIDIKDVIFKLSMRVIVPFIIGQIIRCIFTDFISNIVNKYKHVLKKVSELSILYIVFCSMSDTFNTDFDATLIEIVIMLAIVIFIHAFTAGVVWFSSGICDFKFDRKGKNDKKCDKCMRFNIYDRITMLYCSIQKTVAFGIPIIETLYSDDDRIGIYILPLLLYVPVELIMDAFFVNCLHEKSKEYEYTVANLNIENQLTPVTPVGIAYNNSIGSDQYLQQMNSSM